MTEENNNLETWDKLKAVPDWAQKKILTGRLKNMTDVKPQWRYQRMTEVYGPCGVGWYYSIEKTWTEQGSNEQICQFAGITLYTTTGLTVPNEWSAGIPAVGGSMLIAREKVGTPQERLYTSDEAVKMAVTDALGTAMKMLGLASDIYMGGNHDSKYEGKKTVDNVKEVFKGAEKVDKSRISTTDGWPSLDGKPKTISDKQEKLLFAIGGKAGIKGDDLKLAVKGKYNIEHLNEITMGQFNDILEWVQGGCKDE